MTTVFCSACNADNHPNSSKCEQCNTLLSNDLVNDDEDDDKWENDFLYIENAELKGNIFKLENLEETDEVNLGLKTTCDQITQPIKEEPELQIESDILVGDKEDPESKTRRPLAKSKTYSKSHEIHLKLMRNYIRPNSTSTRISKCDLCSESFSDSNDLKAHRSVCETKEKFYCDVCKIFVSCKNALRKHNSSRQHIYYLGNPLSEDNSKFVCLFCDEKFPLQILLTNHKKNHKEEIELINETSRTENVGGRTTYVCKICGKSSTRKTNHTNHLRVHTKEKPTECDLCQSIVIRTNLHSDRPFKCHICERGFLNKSALRKHLFIHTGQRPFKCKYCDKTFTLGYVLNDHVRLIHTGETPYQCEECKDSFKTSNLLKWHRRKKHGIYINRKSNVKILQQKIAQSRSPSPA